jgi:hypothetical protein
LRTTLECQLKPQVQEALGELLAAPKERLLALSVVRMGVVHALTDLKLDDQRLQESTHTVGADGPDRP